MEVRPQARGKGLTASASQSLQHVRSCKGLSQGREHDQ